LFDVKKCTSLAWNLRSEPKLTEAQKKVLAMFFETGPATRYGFNKELKSKSEKFQGENRQNFSYRHGKSFNTSLDVLVQLKLLDHQEFHRELLNIKHPDLGPVEPKLRIPVREAFQENDFSCPPRTDKKRWKKALDVYRITNYNERIGNKIGESLYRLTIWGIILHLRNEGKLPSGQVTFMTERIDPKSSESKSTLTEEDIHRILPHLRNSDFSIIHRKWDYLCSNNDKRLVFHKLIDALILANHYYEWFHADSAGFENSAIKDINLHFLMPYRLNQPYADDWIKSIVKDREMFDILMESFAEFKDYYRSGQEIANEYSRIVKEVRKNGTVNRPKFLKNNDLFCIKLPFSLYRHGFYLGHGPWGYRLSYFLNELDSGPIGYAWSRLRTSRKYRTKQKQNYMTLSIGPLKNIPLMTSKDEQSSSTS
jgi:hypothetical protein